MVAQLPYRPCVGIMLINRDGLVFVGNRAKDDRTPVAEQAWQMPQGGIDDGEEPLAAALRELFEETGVRSVSLLAEARDWFSYDLPAEALKHSWRGKYRGQTQKWFAFRFEGDEAEINILAPGDGAHKAEFNDWRWVPMAELPGLIVPFKREVYEKVCEAFRSLGSGA